MKRLALSLSLLLAAGCSVRLSVKEAAFSGDVLAGVEDALGAVVMENEPAAIPTPAPPAAPVVIEP